MAAVDGGSISGFPGTAYSLLTSSSLDRSGRSRR